MAIQKTVEKDALGNATFVHYALTGPQLDKQGIDNRISMRYMEAVDAEVETVFTVGLETLDKAIQNVLTINDDQRLSEIGKTEKRRPIYEELVRTLSGCWFMLDNFETRIAKRQAALVDAPKLDPTHSAMAVEDMEIRNWWRAQPTGDRLKMIEKFDGTEKANRIAIALMRSPIALLDMEATAVAEKWAEYRRGLYPAEAGFIDVATASIEWGRRGISHVAGIARVYVRLQDQEMLKIIVTSPGEGQRLGYKVFGFSDRQASEMKRYLEILATAKKAA